MYPGDDNLGRFAETLSCIHPHEPDRMTLARLPTPVECPERLAEKLDIGRIFFKRDDLTGLATSGNKVRKLEYVVAQALANDADTLVTVGGAQSNHCRATAAVAARLGLHCCLLMRSDDPSPPVAGNLLLDELFGAETQFFPVARFNSQRESIIESALDDLRQQGHKPFFVELGASIPHGNWGFIRCIHELVQQLGNDAAVDIYCATGSGGTQAGLILGKALFDCQSWNVFGVPVCDDVDYFQKTIRRLERETVELFALDVDESETPIRLIDGFKGAGYGVPTQEAVQLIRDCARYAGLLLDPVYTSKALAGMLASIRETGLRPETIPLFILTGGVFGLMARHDLFEKR